jgi:DNA-binding MarR family transcriptional regulator
VACTATRFCSSSGPERLVDEHLQRLGVSDEQFALLSLIGLYGPVTPTALAARMGVPLTTLADAVRRLDARGEIERLPNPEDGRSHLLTLSATGHARRKAAHPGVVSSVEDVRRHLQLTLEEVETAMDDVHRALQEAVAGLERQPAN